MANIPSLNNCNRDSTVVLLPGGILEEHGPYLPSFTDGYRNLAMTKDIAESIAKRGMKALIFPIIPLGNGGANELGKSILFLVLSLCVKIHSVLS